jgi:hypothetical protein
MAEGNMDRDASASSCSVRRVEDPTARRLELHARETGDLGDSVTVQGDVVGGNSIRVFLRKGRECGLPGRKRPARSRMMAASSKCPGAQSAELGRRVGGTSRTDRESAKSRS